MAGEDESSFYIAGLIGVVYDKVYFLFDICGCLVGFEFDV